MICGYCSCEQNSQNSDCKYCGNDVTGNRKTAHWEGGAGQRDRSKMSRNDPKKFAGLNKTIPASRK